MRTGSRRGWALLALAWCACHHGSSSTADLALPADVDAALPADLALAVDLANPANPYASPGPTGYSTTTVTASLAGNQYPITIYLPSVAGMRPVVAISPGFQQIGEAYTPYAERLASFGIIVLLRDDPGLFTGSPGAAEELTDEITTFLPAQAMKSGGPLEGKVDLAKVGLLGHSRGGQVSLIAATQGLKGKVAAYFGLDPVDSMQSGTTVRAALPDLGIPSVYLGETLDGTSPLGAFGAACAPTADNYTVLYGQSPSPSLQLTAIGAAHFDFERADKASGASVCQTGTANPHEVLDMAVALSTGLFARELLAQPVGAALDGAGADFYIQTGRLTRSQK
jgi:hypothetical protein